MSEINEQAVIDALTDEIEELSSADINLEQPLTALPVWNSINALFILNRLKQDFAVTLTIDEIRETGSVRQLILLMRKKQKHEEA